MQLGFVLSLLFAIIVAIFALNNGEEVTIDFLFTTQEVSQALVILVSTAFGAIIVAVFGLVRQIKLSMKVKDQGKKIKTLQEEKDELLLEVEGKNNDKCKDENEVPTPKDNKQQKPEQQEMSQNKLDENKTDINKAEVKQETQHKEGIDKELEKELEKEFQQKGQ